jgi:hypothetical protein
MTIASSWRPSSKSRHSTDNWPAAKTLANEEPELCARPSRVEWIWQWTLRLLLPVIIGLYVMLIFWLVFDGKGSGAWGIVSGVLLGLIAVCVAVWAWSIWLPQKDS